MFNINKFCDNRRNNVQYKKLVTSGNNPQISNKMLFSQIVGKKSKPIFVQHPQYLKAAGSDIIISRLHIIGNIVNGNIVNGNIVNGNIVNGNIVNGNIVNGNINVNVNGNIMYGNLVNCDIRNTVINGITIQQDIENGDMVNGNIINGNVNLNTINNIFNANIINVNITYANINIRNNGMIINDTTINSGKVNSASIYNIDINNTTINNGIIKSGNITNNADYPNGIITNGEIITGTIADGKIVSGNIISGSIGDVTIINGRVINGTLEQSNNITKFYFTDKEQTGQSEQSVQRFNYTFSYTNSFDVETFVVNNVELPNNFNHNFTINIPMGVLYSGNIICQKDTNIDIINKISSVYYDVYINDKLQETIIGYPNYIYSSAVLNNTNTNINNDLRISLKDNVYYETSGIKKVYIKEYLANYYGKSKNPFTNPNEFVSYKVNIKCRATLTQTITYNNIYNLGNFDVDITPSIIINIANGNIINNSEGEWRQSTNNDNFTDFLVVDG